MSQCVECGSKMHPADAAQSLICGRCRRHRKDEPAYAAVRSISRQGTDAIGRKARATGILGGTAGDDYDPDSEADE